MAHKMMQMGRRAAAVAATLVYVVAAALHRQGASAVGAAEGAVLP